MPVHEVVAQNKFRQDLLYRINTVEIRIPPLNERIEDIPSLVDHFLKIYCKKYHKPLKKLSSATLKRLEKYHWPGNVRELQHAIERAIIMSESIEKLAIHKAISKHGGNITHAAKELGLSRASLYRRMDKYGL
jgi:transcriptional regulator with PAS, ATPase and Fis domain